ncbi:MAG: carboxypeptidase regulatory-like domain-containing protein, partial [Gemmatimonadales bacterium]
MRFIARWSRVVSALGIVALAGASSAAAQGPTTATVSGLVTGADGGILVGVQIVVTNRVTGTEFGTVTDGAGQYSVSGLRPGPYQIAARFIGFGPAGVDEVQLAAGDSRQFDFTMGATAIRLDAIDVLASRAIERTTPVAYSNVDKIQMEQQLGSQDIPLVMNVTPSVYATESGGGAGDARINVRGFDQRNVAIMINGVPVNDMENGWVYWSNWDGVGDATSTIQLQRGLSAVNLATPSVGGSMNIITDPSATRRGAMFKQEVGTDGFLKTTLQLATGTMGNFALMAQGVRKTGNGLAEGLWTDAWAYFIAATYEINESNRLDLYAIGAPQRHGQRLYRQNIGAMNADFARGLSDYDPLALDDYPEAADGLRYNENWNAVSSSYTGQQAVGDNRID